MMESPLIKKLDLSKFDEPTREFILKLQRVLSSLSADEIEEHSGLARKAPTGIYDDQYLAMPAFFSLLAYGVEGVEALYRLAVQAPPDISWVHECLIAAALPAPRIAVGAVGLSQSYLDEASYNTLVERIESSLADKNVRDKATEMLGELVGNCISDPSKQHELHAMIGAADGLFSGAGESPGAATDLILGFVVQSSLKVSTMICDSLEELLEQDKEELAYQKYFEEHPALLDPLASEVVPRQRLAEEFYSDFVIRRLDDQYVFVEIEKPKDPLFTQYPHPSGKLAHAIGQVLCWLAWVEDNIAYARTHSFPGIHSPRGVVVIGRSTGLNDDQHRMLGALNDAPSPRLEVLTYDDILTNARNVVRNIVRR